MSATINSSIWQRKTQICGSFLFGEVVIVLLGMVELQLTWDSSVECRGKPCSRYERLETWSLELVDDSC